MIQLSKKLLTFVPSVETDWQHRGELLALTRLRIWKIQVNREKV